MIGFEELSRVFDKSSKSFMRMFGPQGNTQESDLFAVTITCRSRRAFVWKSKFGRWHRALCGSI
jgi:hypothetical protein